MCYPGGESAFPETGRSTVCFREVLTVCLRPEAAVEKVLLTGVVGSCSVPRVFSEERHIQENEPGKEACEERETQFESAVLYGIECDRHKSKDAEYPTNNSNEG